MSRLTAWTLHWGVAAVAATGSGLVWIVYLAAPAAETEVESFAIGHPWQPSLTAIHILAGPLLVFGVGLVWRDHVWPRFRTGLRERRVAVRGPGPGARQGQGRGTGMLLTGLFAPLVISGYVLQVAEGESVRQWLGWIHSAAGVFFGVGYVVHQFARPPVQIRGPTAAVSRESTATGVEEAASP